MFGSIMQWLAIPGYEGLYEASRDGFIRRVNGRTLKTFLAGGRGSQYLYVSLSKGGIVKKYPVHRLIALSYLGDIDSKEVNHKDANKLNNNADNLEIVTRQENIRHAVKNGLHAFGSRAGTSKLDESDVEEIRTLRKAGYSVEQIASRYDISLQRIRDIIKGRSWTHVPTDYVPSRAGAYIGLTQLQLVFDAIAEDITKPLTKVALDLSMSESSIYRTVKRLQDIGSIIRGDKIIIRPTEELVANWYSAKMLERRRERLQGEN